MPGRLFLHVQHLLGTGHLRRAAALAHALDAAGWDVALASGGFPVSHLEIGGAALHQLPPMRASSPAFDALLDETGAPVTEAWKAARRDALLALFRAAKPDILMIEMFPFGRRQLRFELLPLLDAARETGARVVCSVRDVLVRKGQAREAEAAALVRERFDLVLVHGDPGVLRLEDSFGPAAEIADLVHYTGYVAGPPADAASQKGPGRDEVIVSAGGSAAGRSLIEAAAGAFDTARRGGETWRLLVGGEDAEEFAASMPCKPGLIAEPARPDFRALLSRAAVSVSQAGYNTVMDVVRTGVKAVFVPYAPEKETEQTQRARAFAALGHGVALAEAELTPVSLAEAIEAARAQPRPVRAVKLDGEAESVARLERLLAEGA